jgi:DNA-binding NarL/FixJ family response regulator
MRQIRHVSSEECEEASDPNLRNPGQDLLSEFEWQDIADVLSLSARELQVAKLLFEGCTRDQIGSRLRKPSGDRLSLGTVRVYIDRLYEKACVDDRTALVLRVVRIFLGRDR